MICQAHGKQELEIVRGLFLEYSRTLGFDLCFQEFTQELASLPGKYVAPGGCLLLAFDGDVPAGCVALRGLEPGMGELKRLYVKPAFRGKGRGSQLVEAAVTEARKLGYRKLRLDTVPAMKEAIGLYRRLGFKEIPPYCANPVPGALFLELDLSLAAS